MFESVITTQKKIVAAEVQLLPEPCQPEFEQLLTLVDVVSFDLFDTLIERRDLFSPKDLFRLVQDEAARKLELNLDDFTTIRIRAENQARVRAWGKGCQEVTLEQIYAELGRLLRCDETTLQRLQKIELDCERTVLCPLASGQAQFKAALAAGKRIIITSDTYFAEGFVTEIIEQCGYHPMPKVFLSSTWGKTKQDGSLYDVVLNDLSCVPGRLLHVGDNQLSDITMALGRGIRTHYMPTAKQRLRWRYGTGDSPSGDPGLSALFCTLSQRAGQTTNRLDQSDILVQTATEHLAPLYYAFAAWLVAKLKEGGYRRVYFAARDGLIMKRFFDLVAGAAGFAIDSRYLYVSRAALYPSLIFTDPDAARRLFSRAWDHLTVEEALRRLSITFEETSEQLAVHGLNHRTQRLEAGIVPAFLAFLAQVWPLLESKNATNYQSILAYLRQEMVLDDEKAAFVDIGWHGSLQDCLVKVLKHLGIAKELHGYYLGTFVKPGGATADFVSRGFLVNNEEPSAIAQLVRFGPSLLELFHSAGHGGVLGYVRKDNQMQPVFEKNLTEQEQFRTLIEPMQQLAFDIVAQALKRLPGHMITAPQPELVARTALRVIYAPTPSEAALFGRLRIATDFGGRMKSITGALEWNLRNVQGETLPDGTVPIWRPGFQILKRN